MTVTQPEGNCFDKYHHTGILINLIMSRYFQDLDFLLSTIAFTDVFEAGCGEGHISSHIHKFSESRNSKIKVTGCDLSPRIIGLARNEFPQINFKVESIYDIKEEDFSYDLVVACEVLEHLEYPEKALEELFRITKRFVLISVPREPIWSIANFMRGKYLLNLGNTPGHIKHWNRKEIIKLVSSNGKIIDVKSPFPWTMILTEKN